MSTNMIKQNSDGSPWTVVRMVAGTPILMAAISTNDGGWIEVDAWRVSAMINKATTKSAAPTPTNSKAATAKALLEITSRYRTGGVR